MELISEHRGCGAVCGGRDYSRCALFLSYCEGDSVGITVKNS